MNNNELVPVKWHGFCAGLENNEFFKNQLHVLGSKTGFEYRFSPHHDKKNDISLKTSRLSVFKDRPFLVDNAKSHVRNY